MTNLILTVNKDGELTEVLCKLEFCRLMRTKGLYSIEVGEHTYILTRAQWEELEDAFLWENKKTISMTVNG